MFSRTQWKALQSWNEDNILNNRPSIMPQTTSIPLSTGISENSNELSYGDNDEFKEKKDENDEFHSSDFEEETDEKFDEIVQNFKMRESDEDKIKNDEVMSKEELSKSQNKKMLSSEDALTEINNKLSAGMPKIISSIAVQYDPKLFKKNSNDN